MNTTATRPLQGPALAEAMRRRDDETIVLLWDELARTNPSMFASLWRRAHRPSRHAAVSVLQD